MLRTLANVWWYAKRVLPLALVALGIFFALYPWRKRRLARLGLVSAKSREAVLACFAAFCAGLAAITMFPSEFWSIQNLLYVRNYSGVFYSWDEVLSSLDDVKEMFIPFQEIRRAVLAGGHYWLWFLLVGNIVMFMPIGFFSKLLWRKWTWWKSMLVGFCASTTIEFVQLFNSRSTDIDDVILNTLGAALGWFFAWLLERFWPRGAEKCKVQEAL